MNRSLSIGRPFLIICIAFFASSSGTAGEQEVRALSVLFPSDAIAVQRAKIANKAALREVEMGKAINRLAPKMKALEGDPVIGPKAMAFFQEHSSEMMEFARKQKPEAGNLSIPPHLAEEFISILQLTGQDAEDARVMFGAGNEDDSPFINREGPVHYFLIDRSGDWITFVPTDPAILNHQDQAVARLAQQLAKLRISSTTAHVEFLGLKLDSPEWRDHPHMNGTIKGLGWELSDRTSPPPPTFLINGREETTGILTYLNVTFYHHSGFGRFFGSVSKTIHFEATASELEQPSAGPMEDGKLIVIRKDGVKEEHERHGFIFAAVSRSQIPATVR